MGSGNLLFHRSSLHSVVVPERKGIGDRRNTKTPHKTIKFPTRNPLLDSKPSTGAVDLARPPQQWRPFSRYGSLRTLTKHPTPSYSPLTRPAPLLFQDPSKLSVYRDRRFPGTQEEFEAALLASLTVYVGNMSFYTTEEQAYELFSRAGEIKKIIMGLDKNTKTPCGFCFVLCVLFSFLHPLRLICSIVLVLDPVM